MIASSLTRCNSRPLIHCYTQMGNLVALWPNVLTLSIAEYNYNSFFENVQDGRKEERRLLVRRKRHYYCTKVTEAGSDMRKIYLILNNEMLANKFLDSFNNRITSVMERFSGSGLTLMCRYPQVPERKLLCFQNINMDKVKDIMNRE